MRPAFGRRSRQVAVPSAMFFWWSPILIAPTVRTPHPQASLRRSQPAPLTLGCTSNRPGRTEMTLGAGHKRLWKGLNNDLLYIVQINIDMGTVLTWANFQEFFAELSCCPSIDNIKWNQWLPTIDNYGLQPSIASRSSDKWLEFAKDLLHGQKNTRNYEEQIIKNTNGEKIPWRHSAKSSWCK